MRLLHPIMKLETYYRKHSPTYRGWGLGSRLIRIGIERLGLQPPVLHGPDGILLEYAPDFTKDTVLHDTALWGAFEDEERRVLRDRTPRGGVFIDVGANFGYFALMASKWVGPEGRVFAFEPVSKTAKQLIRNISLNKAQNIEVLQAACTAEEAEMTMCIGDDSGKAYLKSDGPGERVRTIRLDGFVDQKELDRVDLLKVDAEGADFEVIKGAKETLERFRPMVWLETYYLRRFGFTVDDVRRYMEGLGYECNEQCGEHTSDMLCLPRS